jgi:hypothetical protein
MQARDCQRRREDGVSKSREWGIALANKRMSAAKWMQGWVYGYAENGRWASEEENARRGARILSGGLMYEWNTSVTNTQHFAKMARQAVRRTL